MSGMKRSKRYKILEDGKLVGECYTDMVIKRLIVNIPSDDVFKTFDNITEARKEFPQYNFKVRHPKALRSDDEKK